MILLLAEAARSEPMSTWEAVLVTAFCLGSAMAVMWFIAWLSTRR